ncbi:MAG: CHAD domain-containing protein, partial [Bdellovibrionales bacterium]
RADLAGVSRKTSRMDRELLREAIADLRGEIAGWNKRRISNKSQIHGLRIAAKRTRYTLEALGEKVRPLIVLQDELGDLHDLEILKHLLGSNAQIEGDMRALKGKIHKLKLSALPFALKKLSTLANSKARFT